MRQALRKENVQLLPEASTYHEFHAHQADALDRQERGIKCQVWVAQDEHDLEREKRYGAEI